MHVFHSFQEITHCGGAVLALGTFDGVHLGHQKVMKEAVRKAAAAGGSAVVITFAAHPLSVLNPQKEPLRLATVKQKIRYIAGLGVDALILLPMTKHLLDETPEEFCRQLVEYLHPAGIVVGENFTYGAKAAGNTQTLQAYMAECGVPVSVLPLLERPGRAAPISSTVIRRLVTMGHMETAAALLGRPFALEGLVVQGDQRGRLIGYPTANMLIPAQMAVPADGVYITEAEWRGGIFPAMTNIGANPTFDNQYRRIETHILQWQGNLYGEEVNIRFYKRLRPEVRFPGKDELIAQMDEDKRQTLMYFSFGHN